MAQAEKNLLEYGVRRPDALELLRPAQDLLLDSVFWQHPSEGLAIFISKESSRIYRLPIRFDEVVVVGKGFYVEPIYG